MLFYFLSWINKLCVDVYVYIHAFGRDEPFEHVLLFDYMDLTKELVLGRVGSIKTCYQSNVGFKLIDVST